MDNGDLLELIRNQNKKITILIVILVCLLVCMASMLYYFVQISNRIFEVSDNINIVLGEIQTITDEINKSEIIKSFENASSGIAEGIKKIEEIDIESLNKAISDLKSVISPLANLFR